MRRQRGNTRADGAAHDGADDGRQHGADRRRPQRHLLGAGATFPDPVYQEFIGAFTGDNPGVSITYEAIGSGGGVEQFTAQSTDFGGSDAFMKDEELAAAEAAWGCDVVHIPTVFGAVAVAFNLSGVDQLTLDSDTLAKIFLGTITKWNDAAIAALNPGVTLPDEDIIVAHRSDGSGTTSIFTTYLDHESADWSAQVGKGKEVEWPTGVGRPGQRRRRGRHPAERRRHRLRRAQLCAREQSVHSCHGQQ